MFQKQGAEQRGDVGAVGVGIGQDADLAVAQSLDVFNARVHADGHGDIMNLFGAEDGARVRLPSVEDLAPQGHDRLGLTVAGLFGTASG